MNLFPEKNSLLNQLLRQSPLSPPSLEALLHQRRELPLTWPQRLHVALDVAKAGSGFWVGFGWVVWGPQSGLFVLCFFLFALVFWFGILLFCVGLCFAFDCFCAFCLFCSFALVFSFVCFGYVQKLLERF